MKQAGLVTGMCVGLLALGGAWAIDSEPPFDDPVRAELYEKLIHEVRCLVCQNQTVGDSTAPLAADLRREIRRLVDDGRSEQEVEEYLLARYGDFVLYRPRFQASTAILWAAPLVLVLLGAVTLGVILRRRAAMPVDIDADVSPSSDRQEPS